MKTSSVESFKEVRTNHTLVLALFFFYLRVLIKLWELFVPCPVMTMCSIQLFSYWIMPVACSIEACRNTVMNFWSTTLCTDALKSPLWVRVVFIVPGTYNIENVPWTGGGCTPSPWTVCSRQLWISASSLSEIVITGSGSASMSALVTYGIYIFIVWLQQYEQSDWSVGGRYSAISHGRIAGCYWLVTWRNKPQLWLANHLSNTIEAVQM